MRTHVPHCAATLLIALLALSLPGRAQAAPRQAAKAPAPSAYVLPDSESWELTSKDGAPYRILVSKPSDTPPPANGYPVLYILDGNTIFASFAESRRLLELSSPNISNSLIVAVGYPTDKAYDHARRMEDLTPPFRDPVPVSEKPFVKWKVGGQDRLLSFLLERLRPAVASRYPIDVNRQALFGHSLGGLFVLHVLYTRPEAFHALIAASPSQYWNGQSILKEEREFAGRLSQGTLTSTPARLLLVAGDREETEVEGWDVEPLAQRLQPLSAYGLRTHFEIFKEETHLTVPSRAVTSTLRFAFAWP